MTQVSRNVLKGYFNTNDTPTEDQFAALIDSGFNLNDDTIPMTMVSGLVSALSGKATTAQVNTLIGDITSLTGLPDASKTNIVAVLQYLLSHGTDITNPTAFTVTSSKSEIAPGTVIGIGFNPWPLFKAMLSPYAHAVYNAPGASLTGNLPPAQYEVGQVVAITFATAFTQRDAGAQTGVVINKGGSPLGGTTDSITVGLTAISYQAVISFAQGILKQDTNGADDPTGRIAAGSVGSNTLSYQGSLKVFYGATDTAINAGNLRTALTAIWLSGSEISFSSGSTARNFYIAVPPGHTLSSWIDSTALGADLKAASTNSVVNISDGGTGTLAYTLYKVTNGAPYDAPGDNFKFIVA